jgi:hypothetical protein
MRMIMALAATMIAMSAVNPAAAQTYPWCAYYSGGDNGGGGTNCGFTTYEQCWQTIQGIGGICDRNPSYRAAIVPLPARNVPPRPDGR